MRCYRRFECRRNIEATRLFRVHYLQASVDTANPFNPGFANLIEHVT